MPRMHDGIFMSGQDHDILKAWVAEYVTNVYIFVYNIIYGYIQTLGFMIFNLCTHQLHTPNKSRSVSLLENT